MKTTALILYAVVTVLGLLYTGYRLFGGEPIKQRRNETAGERFAYLVSSVLVNGPAVYVLGLVWGWWE